MKKFSTGLLFAGCSALPAALAEPSEHRLSPQPRVLAPSQPVQQAAGDGGRLPAVVLDADAGPFAEVLGPAAARAGARLSGAGQAVRIAPAVAADGALVAIYRPGPMLRSADGRADLGRMAFLVGSARIVGRDAHGKGGEAVIANSNREVAAGDIVMAAPATVGAGESRGAVHAIAARIAVQSGAKRMRLAGAHQAAALDRGRADGVRAGMCLRAARCGGHGAVIGRILHAGQRASVAQVARAAAPLEWGDEVCVTACLD
ncbi:hypothetical protein [Herbaspirillum sp.]|uniref:hypothetical protein n=1 Tax=Herbaspirillum sp. TaxID=1890675 RepID=UPI0025BC5199|nr:hypothetical protein [Herbaspirillum sp.]